MMVEIYDDKLEKIMLYYGNDSYPLADFPFNFRLIEELHDRTDITGFTLHRLITQWLDQMPKGMWPNWVVSISIKYYDSVST